MTRWRGSWVVTWTLGWLVLSAAAPAGDIDQALQVADELERQGAFAAARQQLHDVVGVVEAAEGEGLALRLCSLWVREGQPGSGRLCYLGLAPRCREPENAALARYRAATLAVELGSRERGKDELTRLLHELPETDAARRALTATRELHRERGGAGAEVDFLLGLASRLGWVAEPGGSASAARRDAVIMLAEVLVEVGRLRLLELQDTAGAARILERAVPVAQQTRWDDDALIWLARARRAQKRHEAALESYRRLVAGQETSWFVGVYHSEFYDDALLEIGLTLEELGRTDEAVAAYDELLARLPTSRLVDDAAFFAAQLLARHGQKQALWTFLRKHPGSRHTQAAQAMVEQP